MLLYLSNDLTVIVDWRFVHPQENQWLTSLSVTRDVRRTRVSDGCTSVMATQKALSLKLVTECQGKLTPRVHRPLCRWTIEPCIRMKHPPAMTEPLRLSSSPAIVPRCSDVSLCLTGLPHTFWTEFTVDPTNNSSTSGRTSKLKGPTLILYLCVCKCVC